MQLIIMSCLFSLVNLLAYAADTLIVPVSHAAEKTEIIISEVTLPKEISFTIPTENGQEIHTLNINDNEAISLIPFKEIIKKKAKKGLPMLVALASYQSGKKVAYSAYKATNLSTEFEYQLTPQDDLIEEGVQDKPDFSKLYNPLTNSQVIQTSVHLVDIPTCNTPETLPTFFLGNMFINPDKLPKTNEIIYSEDLKIKTKWFNLNQIIEKLAEIKGNKEIRTIRLFIEAGNIYSSPQPLEDDHLSVYNAQLALTFFNKALTAINNLPKDIYHTYNTNKALKEYMINCYKKSGDLLVGLYNTYKEKEKKHYADNAFKCYYYATELGDELAKQNACDFIEKTVDDISLHGLKYRKKYLQDFTAYASNETSKNS